MSRVVPDGWEVKRLGEVCDVIGGGTPSRNNPQFWDGDIPWVTPSEVTNLKSRYLSSSKEGISSEGLNGSSAKLHPIGTVLMTSRASIGFVAINTVPMTTNQGFQSLRCKSPILNEYLFQLIINQRRNLESISVGSTFLEVSSGSVQDLKILVPPIPEQQTIASILTSVDEVIEKTQSQINKLQDLKKGTMNELLTRGIGHTDFKDSPVGRIPVGWEVKEIGEMGFEISDGNYSSKYPKSSDFVSRGVPFIRANNIKNLSVVWHDMKYISLEQHCDLKKGHLKKGDILITTRGEIGKVALVPNSFIDANINAQLVRINTRNKMDNRFLLNYLISDSATEEIESLETGTALKQLPVGQLQQINLPTPPPQEQQQIASILSSMDTSIEEKQRKLQQTQSLKQSLMQDLLTGKVRVIVH